MNTFLERLRRLFGGQPRDNEEAFRPRPELEAAAAGSLSATLDDDSLRRLLLLVEQTEEGEYGCRETLDLLDEYAELEISDKDAAHLMPLVRAHLEHCVDCGERYEALLKIMQSD